MKIGEAVSYGGRHFVNLVTRRNSENTNLQDLVKCLHLKTVKVNYNVLKKCITLYCI